MSDPDDTFQENKSSWALWWWVGLLTTVVGTFILVVVIIFGTSISNLCFTVQIASCSSLRKGPTMVRLPVQVLWNKASDDGWGTTVSASQGWPTDKHEALWRFPARPGGGHFRSHPFIYVDEIFPPKPSSVRFWGSPFSQLAMHLAAIGISQKTAWSKVSGNHADAESLKGTQPQPRDTHFWAPSSIAGWWFGTCFYFPIYWESNHPNWLSYFSEGFKPPTR